jgi:AraC-like DNA-binding protein
MLDVESGAELSLATFPRNGVPRDMHLRPLAIHLSKESGWQCNGGNVPNHPAKSLPISLSIPLQLGGITRVHLVGVFSLYAKHEKVGTHGASLCGYLNDNQVFALDLVHGRHYQDAHLEALLDHGNGDGSHVSTVGCVFLDGARVRVDVFSVDIPSEVSLDRLVFRDTGTPASFVIYDVVVETPRREGKCPFHSGSRGIPLSDVAGVVRVRDRVRFQRAVQQVHDAFHKAADLEEARSEALTFLAVVTAGMLEAGGSRELHRVQLEAARIFDKVNTISELIDESQTMIERVVGEWLHQEESQPKLIDKALSIVDRNFGNPITDEDVADQIGLSTSHFRFLFKQSVGQPFHKFLISTRLEKAKAMFEQGYTSVSEVSQLVGFSGLASFSRAFTQRFGVSPSEYKKVRGL